MEGTYNDFHFLYLFVGNVVEEKLLVALLETVLSNDNFYRWVFDL